MPRTDASDLLLRECRKYVENWYRHLIFYKNTAGYPEQARDIEGLLHRIDHLAQPEAPESDDPIELERMRDEIRALFELGESSGVAYEHGDSLTQSEKKREAREIEDRIIAALKGES